MTLKQFLAGCWFGCSDHPIFDRNRQGQLVFRCERCGREQAVLTTAAIKGPCHQPSAVMGKPVVKVKRLSERRIFAAQASRRS